MSENTDQELREGFHQTDLGWNEREDPVYKDPVTHGYNRAAYEVFMPRLLGEAHESKIPLTMAVLDLDMFKQINDTLGHSIADEKLKELTEKIESIIRQTDYVFRYGGDESVIVFRNLTKAEAERSVLPKIREKLKDGDLSVSVGMTEQKERDDARSMFDRAEKLMYEEKRGKK
ncbi:MAG TPA: GGDEF domain-containing protein [Patescibacteria group bacterium]|nr:GGDEF domain-containing protein [Patescibacteria group bacterium]